MLRAHGAQQVGGPSPRRVMVLVGLRYEGSLYLGQLLLANMASEPESELDLYIWAHCGIEIDGCMPSILKFLASINHPHIVVFATNNLE